LALRLTVNGIEAGYGAVRALHGVSMAIEQGETVALLGTNGNGKSTLMKCVMGIVRPSRGEVKVEIDGTTHDLSRMAPEEIVSLGIAMVPEGRPNMIAWTAARMDPGVYGERIAFHFPNDTSTDGPALVEARQVRCAVMPPVPRP